MSIEARNIAKPCISIIVPAGKNDPLLQKCIGSLNRYRPESSELILVTDGIAPDLTTQFAHLVDTLIVLSARHGAAYARNEGVRSARGDIILFIDSDVCILSDTIQRCLSNFEQSNITAVFGSYTTHTSTPGVVTAFKNFQHHFTHQVAKRRAITFWTGCGAIRHEVFNAVGGFETNLAYCEDIALGYQLTLKGYGIVIDPALQVEHLKHYSLASWFYSELIGRAIPWTRLLRRYHFYQNDLNMRFTHLFSAAITLLTLTSLFLCIFYPFLILCAVFGEVIIYLLNRSFLTAAVHAAGAKFACTTFIFLQGHYLIAILGVLTVEIEAFIKRIQRGPL